PGRRRRPLRARHRAGGPRVAAVGVPLTRRILDPPQAPGPARRAGRTLRGSRRPPVGPSVPANSARGASRAAEGGAMEQEKWRAGRPLRGSRRPSVGPSVPGNSAPGAARTGEGWGMEKEKWRAEQWEEWETGPRERMPPPDTRAAGTDPVRERAARTDSASGRGIRTDPVRERAGRGRESGG